MCVMYSKGYHSTTFSLTHHVLDPRERCWLWGSSWGDGGGDAGRAGLPPRGTRRAVARDGSGRTAAVEATRGGGGPLTQSTMRPRAVSCSPSSFGPCDPECVRLDACAARMYMYIVHVRVRCGPGESDGL